MTTAKMAQDLETTRRRVEEILNAFPEARNDDGRLFQIYYELYHGLSLPEGIFGAGVPAMVTIRRSRQAIQQGGEFPPTEEAVARRRKREAAFRAYFAGKRGPERGKAPAPKEQIA